RNQGRTSVSLLPPQVIQRASDAARVAAKRVCERHHREQRNCHRERERRADERRQLHSALRLFIHHQAPPPATASAVAPRTMGSVLDDDVAGGSGAKTGALSRRIITKAGARRGGGEGCFRTEAAALAGRARRASTRFIAARVLPSSGLPASARFV